MGWRGASGAVDELKAHWRSWTSIVSLFARRKRGRRRVEHEAYVELHAALINCCHSLANMFDGEEKAYFQGLEQIARPWVDPQSFRAADREILDDLLKVCRKAERELGNWRWSLPNLPLGRATVVAATLATLYVALWVTDLAWASFFRMGTSWTESLWIYIGRTGYYQYLFIPAVVVVAVSSYVVSRSAHH
jgi:hypothetical protein